MSGKGEEKSFRWHFQMNSLQRANKSVPISKLTETIWKVAKMFQGQFSREHLKEVIKTTQNHPMFICSERHFNSVASTQQTLTKNLLSAGHCAGCQNAKKQDVVPRGLRWMDDSHLSVNIYCTLLDPGTVISTRNTRVDNTSKTPIYGAYILVKEMDNKANPLPPYP